MTDETGTTTWAYTASGQVKQVDTPQGTVKYTYDDAGSRIGMTQPQGSISYAYDDAGRLSSLTDWTGGITRTTYNADDQPVSLARPNGVTTAYGYDQAGRLVSLVSRRGGTLVDQAKYTLDADGNRTSMTNTDGTDHYTLNDLSQLTGVTYSDGTTQTYTYDAAGNRTSMRTGTGDPVSYTYDDASQLTSIGTTPVTHDASGNTTAIGADSYTWDWLGRLQTAAASGATTSYATDGEGYRTSRTTTAGTDTLLYDREAATAGQTLIADNNTSYISIDGAGVAELSSTSKRYVTIDGLNSATAWTDQDGAVTGRASYDVFGAVRDSSGDISATVGYTGATQDGNLVHLGVRDLDTSTGTFLSTDPVSPGAAGVAGWNPYTYVANNPTTLTDPTGALVDGVALYRMDTEVIPEAATTGITVKSALAGFTLLLTLVVPSDTSAPQAPAASAPAPASSSTTTPTEEQEPTPQPQPDPVPLPKPQQVKDDFCKAYGFSHAGQPYQYGPLGPGSRATAARGCIVWPYVIHPRVKITPAFGATAPKGFDSGHLIGNALGGENEFANFSWQLIKPNRGAMWRGIEEPARAEALAGNQVDYEVWLDWTPPALQGGWVANNFCVSWVSSSGSTSKPAVQCLHN
ncbi:MAG: hypothetical protein J0I14_06715 [Propionibacteriaceae bacterium]|nr:hypothetical protein [Propionibacteriaceae bacterium]